MQKTPNTNKRIAWMGFLLVFFPHEHNTNILSSFKRTNGNSNNALLSKAQSTISICAFLFFLTLLLFTLSSFEPTTTKPIPKPKTHRFSTFSSHALQRMGTLYRRGTKPMNDVVLPHVPQDTTEEDFRLFIRTLHRSGVTFKSDVVFLFPDPSFTFRFAPILLEENDSFLSLVQLNSTRSESSFHVTRFLKSSKKIGEPIWGKRIRSNLNNSETEERELTRLSYGSVVSFDVSELDSENSLAGFLDRVPLSLRRWACYPMLLGRVRRNFKHVMLVDVKNVVVLRDPLGRVRNRSPESVFLYAKHGKNSEKTHLVNSAVIMGGARGIRRLSNVMLVGIVRAAMQHKKKNTVSESVVLSQLVRNKFVLKNVDLIKLTESIPETSSLAGSTTSFSDYVMIQRGVGNYDLNSVIKKQICSSVVNSSVYRGCL